MPPRHSPPPSPAGTRVAYPLAWAVTLVSTALMWWLLKRKRLL